MVQVLNIESFIADLKEEVQEMRERCVLQMRDAAEVVLDELMKKTPVWSGETVRNYVAGVGSAGGATKPAAGTVDPGPTNSMRLGEEPRRADNEAEARADLETVLRRFSDLKNNIVFTNTISADKWDLIDNGSAPDPARVRYAAVISVLAEQSARLRLEHFK